MDIITYKELDNNVKKTITENMKNAAIRTYGTVCVTEKQFVSLLENGMKTDVDVSIQDFYSAFKKFTPKIECEELIKHYNEYVAPIIK